MKYHQCPCEKSLETYYVLLVLLFFFSAGCDYNGRHYRLNSEFRSKSDACKLCYCRSGNVHCEERACPPMENCHNLVTSKGDCCPTCLDCGEYQNGTEWEEDDCRICTCMVRVFSDSNLSDCHGLE